jgi:hypothetical protein
VIKDGLHVMPLSGDKTLSVTDCSALLLAQNVSVEMKLALPVQGILCLPILLVIDVCVLGIICCPLACLCISSTVPGLARSFKGVLMLSFDVVGWPVLPAAFIRFLRSLLSLRLLHFL